MPGWCGWGSGWPCCRAARCWANWIGLWIRCFTPSRPYPLKNHLRLLAALSQGAEELPEAESGIVGCALLPDYYVRTGADRLEDVPQIKAELQRIWSDYDFVRSGLTWAEVGKRIADYKRLDILD